MGLSISGHHHPGCEDKSDGGILFVNAPGLCEAPFPYLVVTIDGEEINTCRHELAMPAELQLVDNHVHTQLAYCAEDVTIERCIQLLALQAQAVIDSVAYVKGLNLRGRRPS